MNSVWQRFTLSYMRFPSGTQTTCTELLWGVTFLAAKQLANAVGAVAVLFVSLVLALRFVSNGGRCVATCAGFFGYYLLYQMMPILS